MLSVGCGNVGIVLGGAAGSGGLGPVGGTLSATGGSPSFGGVVSLGGTPPVGGTLPVGGATGGEGVGGFESSGGGSASGGSGAASAGGSGGLSGAGGAGDVCVGGVEPVFDLIGWAAEGDGTTGGQGASPTVVYSGAQLINALEGKNPNAPLIIDVANTITYANSGGHYEITLEGLRDVSIIGRGGGVDFEGVGIHILDSSNIILRNLTIRGVSEGDGDAIGIAGVATESHHIWIDHCDLSADSSALSNPSTPFDGLIDAKGNATNLTYSWNYLHVASDPGLAGANDSDLTDRKLTMHHNWIEKTNSGVPSIRGGNAHVFNNFYQDIAILGVNSRMGACVRLENNVFEDVVNPWVTAYSSLPGKVQPICNAPSAATLAAGSASDIQLAEACTLEFDYEYESVLTATESVKELVRANVGPQLTDTDRFNFRSRWARD